METGWIAVDQTKNLKRQCKLENQEPGTKYMGEMELWLNSKSKVSDKVNVAFRTPPTGESASKTEFCVITCHNFIRKETTAGHKIYGAMFKLFSDFLYMPAILNITINTHLVRLPKN